MINPHAPITAQANVPIGKGRSTGAPTLPLLSTMLKEALEADHSLVGKYGDPQGEHGLRAALSEYLLHVRGVNARPEQIVIGSGIAYSIGI